MNGKKGLLIGGLAAALTIPAGVALAATSGPGPAPNGPATSQPGPGFGPGRHGGARAANREDCPRYNSTEMQKWREQREERQSLGARARAGRTS